jgi:hypothetical protein
LPTPDENTLMKVGDPEFTGWCGGCALRRAFDPTPFFELPIGIPKSSWENIQVPTLPKSAASNDFLTPTSRASLWNPHADGSSESVEVKNMRPRNCWIAAPWTNSRGAEIAGRALVNTPMDVGGGWEWGGARASATAIKDQALWIDGSMSQVMAKIRATIAFDVSAKGMKYVWEISCARGGMQTKQCCFRRTVTE